MNRGKHEAQRKEDVQKIATFLGIKEHGLFPQASGGSGRVYYAWTDDRELAIKVYSDKGLSRLSRFHDIDEAGDVVARFVEKLPRPILRGRPYSVEIDAQRSGQGILVMNYVQGTSLHQYAASEQSFDDRLTAATLLAKSVQMMHQEKLEDGVEGIIHRDIKPANAILTEGIDNNEALHTKLVDLDFATPSDNYKSGSSPGRAFGTNGYVAPEVSEEGVSIQSDVYSLGVSMLTIVQGTTDVEAALASGQKDKGTMLGVPYVDLSVVRDYGAQVETPECNALGRAIQAALDPLPKNRPTAEELFEHANTLRYARKISRAS